MTEKCRLCGNEFEYKKIGKYHPFCSKECFYNHLGKYSVGDDMRELPDGLEAYCRLCGKKVRNLHNGSFCSRRCEGEFIRSYDEYRDEVVQKKRKIGTYEIFCNLCGTRFPSSSKRRRFCTMCSCNRSETKLKCFSISSDIVESHAGDNRSLVSSIIKMRESGKTYAELQMEETLRNGK